MDSTSIVSSSGANTGEDLECGTGPNLLENIRTFCASIGDGLIDEEITWLLREASLPAEEGFSILSYFEGVVTFKVPPQDLEGWYISEERIHPIKEKLAAVVAKKYGLELFQPPDLRCYVSPEQKSLNRHHHIELFDRQKTVVIAHPRYLKVRFYCENARARGTLAVPVTTALQPHLLRDLSGLYQK